MRGCLSKSLLNPKVDIHRQTTSSLDESKITEEIFSSYPSQEHRVCCLSLATVTFYKRKIPFRGTREKSVST